MEHRSRILGVVLALSTICLPWTAVAQSPSPARIELEQVTESGYGVSSVVPVGWAAAGLGVHTRGMSPTDPTLMALQSAPLPIERLWPSLLPQMGLTERPASVGSRDTEPGLRWTLYQVPIQTSGIVADLALAERGGASYLVLLVSPADEEATLHDAVFLPAVDAFTPIVATSRPEGSGNPIPYVEEEVSFPGGASDVTLAGTLSLPVGSAPAPGIVLVSGSGPEDRDESVAPMAAIKPFAIIADALASAGVAVLRFDDRGTAKSTGDYASATVEDLTADAAAALAYVRTRPEVDPARLGLLGHSEGGLEVAEIAAADPTVGFVVGMAPPATKGVDLLVAQNEAILRAKGGVSDTELRLAVQFAGDLFAAVLAGDKAGADQVIRDYAGALWDRQAPDVQRRLGDRATYIQGQVDARMTTLFSPEFVSLLRSDAGAAWARVHVPVLGLFGGKDVQVPALHQAPALEAALQAAGNTQGTVVTMPDANHLFQSAQTGAVGEYGVLDQRFTADFLPTLVGWVRGVTGLAPMPAGDVAGGSPSPEPAAPSAS